MQYNIEALNTIFYRRVKIYPFLINTTKKLMETLNKYDVKIKIFLSIYEGHNPDITTLVLIMKTKKDYMKKPSKAYASKKTVGY